MTLVTVVASGCAGNSSSDGATDRAPSTASPSDRGAEPLPGVPQVTTAGGTWQRVPDVGGATYSEPSTSGTLLLPVAIGTVEGGILDVSSGEAVSVVEPPRRVVAAGPWLLTTQLDDPLSAEERWELADVDGSDRGVLPAGIGRLVATSPLVAAFAGTPQDDGRAALTIVRLPDLAVSEVPAMPPGKVVVLGDSVLVIGTDPPMPVQPGATRLAVHRLDPVGSRWVTQLGPPVSLTQSRGQPVTTLTPSVRAEDAFVAVEGARLVRVLADGRIQDMDGPAEIPGAQPGGDLRFVVDESGQVLATTGRDLHLGKVDGTWTRVESPVLDGEASSVLSPVASADGRFLVQLQFGTQPGLWWFRPA